MEIVSLQNYEKKSEVEELGLLFAKKFPNSKCEVVIRVPGRVNLIGEHIDYCGYAVHPMAIEQDVLVAVGKRIQDGEAKINLSNVESEKYPDFEVKFGKDVEIESGAPHWWKYFICGLKGIAENFDKPGNALEGMNCLVRGSIPPSSGLSSSSAVVVAGAMCTLWANGLSMSKTELAELCAKSERFIGTQGGGMDQAIEILAKAGTAKLIEFNPLRTFDVTLPEGATFVICNSLTKVNKAAGSGYNTRVAECRIATKILGKALKCESWQSIQKLGDLQKTLNIPLNEMQSKVKEILRQGLYSKKEICSILDIDEETLAKECLSANTINIQEFNLFGRAYHVYSEAQRVYDFKNECDNNGPETLKRLGQLMFDSHNSCSKNYECSHQNLDQLVQISKENGALGSRLTGAGWGGCIVSLVPSDKVESYIAAVKENYYDKRRDLKIDDNFGRVVFPTKPGHGAVIITI